MAAKKRKICCHGIGVFQTVSKTPLSHVRNLFASKRPADHAFLARFAREMVCPLTGELRGTDDDGYRSGWS